MTFRGPLVTLTVVAVLGLGLMLVTALSELGRTTPGMAVAEMSPGTPAPPPAQQFPAQADYAGEITTATGVITLEISVDGETAIAYACDYDDVEVWLRGSARTGVLNLASKDSTSRLEGRLTGDTVAGTLAVDARKWDFKAAAAAAQVGP
jgi:hypothetical protein